jgi:uncharacterized protein (TIGR02246 family)
MSDPVYSTPEQAEEAFYAACERADVDAMMRVWADSDDIVCVHPIGTRLMGRRAIEESWRGILSGSRTMKFKITDRRQTRSADLAVHVLHENIRISGSDKIHPPVVATNVYRLTDSGWRLILHHASPTPESGASEEVTVH